MCTVYTDYYMCGHVKGTRTTACLNPATCVKSYA
ncbi:uncharacterized protein EKO05_0010022 [Ascochyta rabiei]|nr:uncharacterized protein EKO05_0010022 [Ascochyta rabiei]UPX19771.1 hypothetical protein EKO05_0010022 [Ascochyta rabiei]